MASQARLVLTNAGLIEDLLKVQSAPGQGTAITGQLPISGSNRNHQRAEAAGRFPAPPRRRPVGCTNNYRLPTTSYRIFTCVMSARQVREGEDCWRAVHRG